MNLVIDIGNTSVKAAIFKGRDLVIMDRIADAGADAIRAFCGHAAIDKVIVSSVGADPSDTVAHLREAGYWVHDLTWQSKFPFRNMYQTPETLGVDRLAAVAGAISQFGQSTILVIDAGSAITYDLISKGVFEGGTISPGMGMRFRALHTFTSRLPLCNYSHNFRYPATNTVDAITGGVIMGLAFELNEYIRSIRKEYTDLVTILTGGDSELFTELIDDEFVTIPDLVIEGLNYLLEYNS
ncbi:MAG TPA: type III pantothenate kinase [Bacteroidales bacterium]|nr:type III pantothenate kinase [Bacteroidales bacterium]